jgi:ATP-binding cassette subfamily F protein 3
MIVVSANDLHKRYGPQVVLDGATLQVKMGEKVGLIGPNGCGKTTLLRAIVGEIEPDQGHLSIQHDVRVGYLPQIPDLNGEQTVAESAQEALAPLLQIEHQAEDLLNRVNETQDEKERQRLLHRHAELLEHFRRAGGYEIKRRVEQVLAGMEFDAALQQRPVKALSGGEQSRLSLARLLLAAPDVLFLDEPTNHLDIEATEWLEGFLAQYDGAAVIVSHDRYLLDRTVSRIVEMRQGKTFSYPGNYTAYEEQREREIETQWKEFKKQQAHIEHEEEFIRRYHYGQRAREARGRAKKLARLERVDKPPVDPKAPALSFVPEVRGGDVVCEFHDVTKAFGPQVLVKGLTLTLLRQERLAILGPNGSGKTTLLRLLMGTEKPTAGRVRVGHNIRPGYFDQEQATIDPTKSVIEEVWQIRPSLSEGQMRGYLGRFLFSDETPFDRISTLSGGERARVALAKVMLAGSNFLLLDEPTNHLDIPAREALEEALLEYAGTLVVVSHDRYFINRIATKILHLEDGRARLYLGDYDSFREKRRAEAAAPKPAPPPRSKPAPKPRDQKDRKRKPLYATSLDQLEKQVIEKEREFDALAALLGDVTTYRDPDRARQVQADFDRVAADLDALTSEWETRVEDLA